MRSGSRRPEKRRRVNVIFSEPVFNQRCLVVIVFFFFESDHRGACSECSEKQLLVSIRAITMDDKLCREVPR